MSTIKVKKDISNLEDAVKYAILKDYISLKMSNREIVEKHSITEKSLENFMRSLYRKFQNARETKTLVMSQGKINDYSSKILQEHVYSDHINKSFLDKLSSDQDPSLTDAEILFCEFLTEYGDDVKAIEKAKLHVGLKKLDANGSLNAEYKDALILRAFYLKRKPNVSFYLAESRKRNLDVLKNGKEYLQTSLIALIDQLRNSGDVRQLPSQLKAIELAGRTIGAFDDKLTLQSGNGDDALDSILARAREAKEAKQELIEIN